MSLPQSKPGDRVRCRIAEIALQPPTSKRKIKAELLVDGQVVHELPLIRDGQQLKWDKLFVFDARHESQFQLAIHERNNRMYSHYPSNTCLLSEITKSPTASISFDSSAYTAAIRFFDQAEAEVRFKQGLEEMKMMERASLLGKLGKARRVFKSMLEIGSAVSELHPAAKATFSICTVAWKVVEQEEKCEGDLRELIESLGEMTELVDLIKDHARIKHLQDTLGACLDLIEDVSIFAMDYRVQGTPARAVYSLFDGTSQEKVADLTKRFQSLRSSFHLSLDAQTAKVVVTANDRNTLKQLNPVEPSGHDPTRACLPGTRVGLLSDIHTWINMPNPTSHFLWIYGQAGIGKSSIATSVCDQLDKEGRSPVSFFCKRDDPALRDPLRLINSVVHGLCLRCPPYAKAVVEAIEKNWELCTSHLGVRYEGLVQKPLEGLQDILLPFPLIMVIDALDECGTSDSRRQVLRYLRDMSTLVPWLRACVTSRADEDIRALFGQYQSSAIFRFDVQAYGAADDIRSFVEARLGSIAVDSRWPSGSIGKICEKAGELFIWAATACKYLDSYNSLDRLRRVIEGSHPPGAFGGLDLLYSTIIHNSVSDEEEDGKILVRRCIGAILATSQRQPLPIQDLGELLQDYVPPGDVSKIVARLGSILYLDESLRGAVRIYHPSFADYAQDKARSHDLWIDMIQSNTELAAGCLKTMNQELYFNICGLETSYLLNSEVLDLDIRVENNITRHLSYSCAYWIDHLIESELGTLISDVEELVLGVRLLYWLEVLSLIGKLHTAVSGLSQLAKRIPAEFETIVDCARDAYRFVSSFFDPISASTPHIYLSALAFSPKKSGIVQRLGHFFPNTVSFTGVGTKDENWPRWLRTFQHPDKVRSLSISYNSEVLATACLDGVIRVWNFATGELITQSSSDYPRFLVQFFPDGIRVASISDEDSVQVWNYKTNEVEFHGPIFAEHTEHTICAAFSLDTTRVVSGSSDTTVRTWSTNTGEALGHPCSGHSDSVTLVAFSPDSTRVISASDDLTVRVWDAILGWEIHRLATQAYNTRYVGFSTDGSFFAYSNVLDKANAVRIWDTNTGDALEAPWHLDYNYGTTLAYSPDGKFVASSSLDCQIGIWDIKSGVAVDSTLAGHTSFIRSLAFSPDGNYIASASSDGTARLWDVKASEISQTSATGNDGRIRSLALSSDGNHIISSLGDGSVRIQETNTGRPIGAPLVGDSIRVEFFALSSDDTRILFATGDQTLELWDIDIKSNHSSPNRTLLAEHSGRITSTVLTSGHACFSVAYREEENVVEIYNGLAGELVRGPCLGPCELDTRFVPRTMFSSDGTRLVIACPDHTLLIWNVAIGEIVGKPLAGHSNLVECVVISPDDTRIISSAKDGTARVWNAGTGEALVHWNVDTNRGEHTWARCMAFCPDGTQVVAGCDDGTVRIWDITTGEETDARLQLTGLSDYPSTITSSPGTTHIAAGAGPHIFLWDLSRTSSLPDWPHNSSGLPSHPDNLPWVSHDQRSHTLWLPPHYRRPFEPRLLHCMSSDPLHATVDLEFSKFVHGTSWESVACDEVRQDCR